MVVARGRRPPRLTRALRRVLSQLVQFSPRSRTPTTRRGQSASALVAAHRRGGRRSRLTPASEICGAAGPSRGNGLRVPRITRKRSASQGSHGDERIVAGVSTDLARSGFETRGAKSPALPAWRIPQACRPSAAERSRRLDLALHTGVGAVHRVLCGAPAADADASCSGIAIACWCVPTGMVERVFKPCGGSRRGPDDGAPV